MWGFDRFEPTFRLVRKNDSDHDKPINEPITLGSSIGLACFDPDRMIYDRSTNQELIDINHLNIYKLLINQVPKFSFDPIQNNSNRSSNLDRFEKMSVFWFEIRSDRVANTTNNLSTFF